MMRVNRIGYPEEVECPDCGEMIDGTEDVLGVVYRCENHECGSMFDGDELFPQADDWTPEPPRFVPTVHINDPR